MNNNQNNGRRKTYCKPMVAVENFALNQFIASCTIRTGRLSNNYNTNWKTELKEYSPLVYAEVMATNQFITEIGCVNHADEIGWDTLCYHTSTSPLFTS